MIYQKFSKGPKYIHRNLIRFLRKVAFIALIKENQIRRRYYSYNGLKSNKIREEQIQVTLKLTVLVYTRSK
jgi:hypothetical protein